MSGKSTTWPHQDLMAEHKIDVAALPEKTRRKIEKFNKETDEDTKESLDEVIFGEIDDIVDDMKKKAAAAAKKEKHSEAKKKALDVSAAATAKTPEQIEAERKAAEEAAKPKSRGVMRTILGY